MRVPLKESQFHLNLGVARVDHSVVRPRGMTWDSRDFHVESQVAVLGIRRLVKADVYNAEFHPTGYPIRVVKSIEWSIAGRTVRRTFKSTTTP